MAKASTQSFSKWKIIVPTILGFGVIVYMFAKDFLGETGPENMASLKQVSFSWSMVLWFAVALLLMVGRDLGFTIRYRYLTDKLLTWKQCVKVTLLAEFGSAITPSTIGGSSMAILFLTKEKVPVGKSTTIVFVTLLLDEMFFVVTFPILLLFIPSETLFQTGSAIETGVFGLFMAAYVIKLFICLGLIVGLFFKPQAIRWLLIAIFKLPFLRRWRNAAIKAGDDIIISSREIRGKRLNYWFPLIVATILSWCSRYLVVNAIFMAFFAVSDNLLVFARQFVMWILMVVSPTPGGSGFTEVIFNGYLAEFIALPGLVPVIILIWRLLTYYNYLFIGSILVPRWAKDAFGKKE
ncbi:uncharacterized protein (TIRG00374 family) [Dysgonomonas sp. PH5-45]|uniref:lysylphosphatidylglycerol synthase transmembrane domain-containing protein n=1 Tax=unclassified Dysgonomonas TaxID=2630389 RepID=UPI0024745C87|nr:MULTISPECIES: lysylphosphatidylglycerol synthase transmembrane domain-containing protein [unclassified Dysgonomonas]MDH6355517.1 uncharacterized protein (TIRG00374 family) [Dysgonomonas sp. PH5-45]MDH6388422.1 uncharacterized protein (TIRG00374 family) [Dysgonomonas sp. PH5-37]